MQIGVIAATGVVFLILAIVKYKIGRGRKEWSNDDYARASKLLDQQAEYLRNFFRGDRKS